MPMLHRLRWAEPIEWTMSDRPGAGIEVVFFLPWAITFRQLGLFGLVEMVIFIVILLVGYVYAWKKGALEWE